MDKTKTLLEVFTARPSRFHLLDKGIQLALLEGSENCRGKKLLEIGCAYGDGAAYLAKRYGWKVTGVDISPELIAAAEKSYSDLIEKGVLAFITGNAEDLAFEENTFDGLVSEAAFSPIANKAKAARGFYRVLKKGGMLLINDFSIRRPKQESMRKELDHIPCFAGVDTMEFYQGLMESNGFRTVQCKEEFGELIRLSMWVSKAYGIGINDIGSYLSNYCNAGSTSSRCNCRQEGGDILKEARLTYCQMIFQK